MAATDTTAAGQWSDFKDFMFGTKPSGTGTALDQVVGLSKAREMPIRNLTIVISRYSLPTRLLEQPMMFLQNVPSTREDLGVPLPYPSRQAATSTTIHSAPHSTSCWTASLGRTLFLVEFGNGLEQPTRLPTTHPECRPPPLRPFPHRRHPRYRYRPPAPLPIPAHRSQPSELYHIHRLSSSVLLLPPRLEQQQVPPCRISFI
jgi:hypothetical protein